MSQERMNDPGSSKSVSGIDYQAPDIDATLSRANSSLSKIRVVNGANEQYFDNLQGKTVGSVRKSLREVFNIPGDASALIGGKEVGDDFILEGGMNLEFVKEAGVKGDDPPPKRVFLQNLGSGEPAIYCGKAQELDEVLNSIRNVLAADLPEELKDTDDIESFYLDYQIQVTEMTDEEVANLPS
jgi:hypothetical protein